VCNYPPPPLISSNKQDSSTISISPLSPELDTDEVVDTGNRAPLVKFSSTLTTDYSSDQFNIPESGQELEIDLYTSPSNFAESLLDSPQLTLFPISGSNALTPLSFSIPKSLSPQLVEAQSQYIQFFLKFHYEKITGAHYFRWYDYPKLCTSIIFSMAEQSNPVRHAMVAFSALIYSCKIHRGARTIAFWYYMMALRELRQLLNITPMNMGECLAALATALLLSSFDVCSLISASN
jgi:hypothetical protein